MQHVSFFAAPLMLGALILAGCQTTQEAAVPEATSTEPEQQWVGTWSGAWLDGGQCSSTITVEDVSGVTAVATYSWGHGCAGNNPGSYTDRSAKVSGDTLVVTVPDYNFGAQYTMHEDGDLTGVWSTLAGEHTMKATFYRE